MKFNIKLNIFSFKITLLCLLWHNCKTIMIKIKIKRYGWSSKKHDLMFEMFETERSELNFCFFSNQPYLSIFYLYPTYVTVMLQMVKQGYWKGKSSNFMWIIKFSLELAPWGNNSILSSDYPPLVGIGLFLKYISAHQFYLLIW